MGCLDCSICEHRYGCTNRDLTIEEKIVIREEQILKLQEEIKILEDMKNKQ